MGITRGAMVVVNGRLVRAPKNRDRTWRRYPPFERVIAPELHTEIRTVERRGPSADLAMYRELLKLSRSGVLTFDPDGEE